MKRSETYPSAQRYKMLLIFYYVVYVLVLTYYGLGMYIAANIPAGEPLPLQYDVKSTAGMYIQYAAILYTLASIPGALYWFKRKCKELSALSEETEEGKRAKYNKYYTYATYRACMIAFAMLVDSVAYTLLGHYKPMLWLTAVAAVAFVFCKPSPRKAEEELREQDTSMPTY